MQFLANQIKPLVWTKAFCPEEPYLKWHLKKSAFRLQNRALPIKESTHLTARLLCLCRMMGSLITASFQTILMSLIHTQWTALNEQVATQYFAPSLTIHCVSLCLLLQPKPSSTAGLIIFFLDSSQEHFSVICECLPNVNQLLFTLEVATLPILQARSWGTERRSKVPINFRSPIRYALDMIIHGT